MRSTMTPIVPRQACGCQRVHELKYGHTCTVHDDRGKRWDTYTIEDLAAGRQFEIEVQTETTEWSCYCGRHKETDDVMPVGTRCVWECSSTMDNEWACHCAEEYRATWLQAQTIDWIAVAKEEGFA